jgi:CubicO group peptidase (beta-lactamase class C family)
LRTQAQNISATETVLRDASVKRRGEALVPSLGQQERFDVTGLAMGIVVGEKLIYARGFGVQAKGEAPVDTQTIFDYTRE